MPSEKVLAEKKKVVDELSDKFKKAVSGVLVDYTGVSVADDTKLRGELRKAGVEYAVKKNSTIRRAADIVGFSGLDKTLSGPTAVAISLEDVVAPAKIIANFAKAQKTMKVKGGFIEGKVVSAKQIDEIAKLPSREVLVAEVLRGLNAPIAGFANVLNANIRGLVIALNAIAEKQSA